MFFLLQQNKILNILKPIKFLKNLKQTEKIEKK